MKGIIDDLGGQQKQADKKLDDFRAFMSEEMNSQIQNALKKEKMKAPQKKENLNDTAMLSSEQREIKKTLTLKADKTDLDKLFTIKSNRVDTENILDVQSIMAKQFKHILVLFVEIVNCQTLKANETKYSLENRIQKLLAQL